MMDSTQRRSTKHYHPIRTVDDLLLHLQWALSVELSTIPPYLCALYSIQDPTSEAYTVIKSVVIEEMLHMLLVGNLMNAVGRSPDLSEEFVPRYPGFMRHHAAGGPYVQLEPFSPLLMRTTFMPIEQPELSPHMPAEGDHFQTIGQFYKAIEEGFEYLVDFRGEAWLFDRDTGCRLADGYFGSGGGHLTVVHTLAEAKATIREITQQGEGAVVPQPPRPGEEPCGTLERYGWRLDGTYGPILGTPWEMSHYAKFKSLAGGTTHPPVVYPMQANPCPDQLERPLRDLSELFNQSYGLLLQSLQCAMSSAEQQVAFFGVAFPIMHSVMPALATLLMQTTLLKASDPALGPTAGPSFQYRSASLEDVVRCASALRCVQPDRPLAYQQVWASTLDQVSATLTGTRSRAGTPRGSPGAFCGHGQWVGGLGADGHSHLRPLGGRGPAQVRRRAGIRRRSARRDGWQHSADRESRAGGGRIQALGPFPLRQW
jgi:hypothetical protein